MNHFQKLSEIKSKAAALGVKAIINEPLFKHTSFKVGGFCDLALYPESVEQLSKLCSACKSLDLYTYILGNGTNVLFTDRGFRGVVFITTAMGEITLEGNEITVIAGTSLKMLCLFALNNGFTGLEFAYGIPGTVGGAVYMNAGAYGGEMKDVLTSVTAIDPDGKLITFTSDQLAMGYRKSVFTDSEYVIVSATLQLDWGNKNEIKEKMDNLMERRKSKQPLEYPSAGSTFKRPEGTYAGLVIEQSGLKGYTVGGAMISEKHANFVINYNKAKSADIVQLIADVQAIVKEKTGYDLEPEVKLIPERRN